MARFKSQSITVGPVTLAYVDSQNTSLFTPKVKEGGGESFGCSIIYGDEVAQQLSAIVNEVGSPAFPQEWSDPNAKLGRAIHATNPNKPQFAPAGNWYSGVSTQFQPQIVDMRNQPIVNTLDPQTGRKPIYDGVLCYIVVNAYDYSNKQRGVSIGLQAIRKWSDGPVLNLGGINLEESFANVPAAPQGAVGAPVPGAGQVPGAVPGQTAPVQQAPAQGFQQAPPQQAAPVQQYQNPTEQQAPGGVPLFNLG